MALLLLLMLSFCGPVFLVVINAIIPEINVILLLLSMLTLLLQLSSLLLILSLMLSKRH